MIPLWSTQNPQSFSTHPSPAYFINVHFDFFFANEALCGCFYLLSGCTLQFLKVTLNPDAALPSACNPSQPNVIRERYEHTSIFQIMTENIASFPLESDLTDISHTTALLGSAER